MQTCDDVLIFGVCTDRCVCMCVPVPFFVCAMRLMISSFSACLAFSSHSLYSAPFQSLISSLLRHTILENIAECSVLCVSVSVLMALTWLLGNETIQTCWKKIVQKLIPARKCEKEEKKIDCLFSQQIFMHWLIDLSVKFIYTFSTMCVRVFWTNSIKYFIIYLYIFWCLNCLSQKSPIALPHSITYSYIAIVHTSFATHTFIHV